MCNRDRILEAATDLFYRNGYRGTSVDDIGAAAGVSKSNFYYHFTSKEELGVAVLARRRADMETLAAATLGDGRADAADRLARFLAGLEQLQVSYMANGGCPFGNFVVEMAEHSERFRAFVGDTFVTLTERIAVVVAEAQRAGAIRSDAAPHDLAALVLMAVQGMHVITKCYRSTATFHEGSRLLLRLVAAGSGPAQSATV